MDERVMDKPKKRSRSRKKKQIKEEIDAEPKGIASKPSVINALQRGVTYKGLVAETIDYRFIVLVHDRFRVLVHNPRFLPLAKQRDVPAHCVVAKGDEVHLTAIKNNNMSKYNEEWLAEKCWIEKTNTQCTTQPDIKVVVYDGTVSSILPNMVTLGSPPQVVVIVPSKNILVHGYHVGSISLNEIFRTGDQLYYEIDSNIQLSGGKVFALRAWFGSSKPNDSTELMKFYLSGGISKEVLVSLSTLQMDKAYNPDEDLDEDEFNLDLKYIVPKNNQSEKNNLNMNKCAPESVKKKTLKKVQPAQDNKNSINMESPRDVQVSNRFDVLSLSDSEDSPGVVNVGTQTYSTGDIFQFDGVFCRYSF